MKEGGGGERGRDRTESLETITDIPLYQMRGMRKEHADRKRDEERLAVEERLAREKASLPEHAWKEEPKDFVF